MPCTKSLDLYTYLFDVVLGLGKRINSLKPRFEPNFFLSSFCFLMLKKIVHVSIFCILCTLEKNVCVCSAPVDVLGSGYDMGINSAGRGVSGPL